MAGHQLLRRGGFRTFVVVFFFAAGVFFAGAFFSEGFFLAASRGRSPWAEHHNARAPGT
jgi:hypothetical protein